MTWHDLSGVRAVSLACCVCGALACGTSSKNATIEITSPEKDQTLTLKDDLDTSKPGLQYNVTASSSGVSAGTEVVLRIEGESDAAAFANVDRDGSILFDQATLPSGTHTIKVVTMTGGVQSADNWPYTFKSVQITQPIDGAALGLGDDKDPDKDGIQINVSVTTDAIDLSADVKLQVDQSTVGDTLHPGADGKLVFTGVTLDNKDHTLKVLAGDVESNVVRVSVNPNCATATFVTPEPPGNGDALTLGGGDKCPASGEQFKTDFTIATDAGDNRDVDLIVNGTLFMSAKVKSSVVRFTDVVLDRYQTANEVSVVVQGAQGVTCAPLKYPVDIKLDCDGVDCSISAPQPVAGLDSNGQRVQYLNKSKRSKDGFEFRVHTDTDAIGKPVKLIIDGNDLEGPTADPSGSDPDVTATFSGVALSEGSHTVQARCEHKSGSVGLSRKAIWIVDTEACGIAVTDPPADSVLVSANDSNQDRSGVQIEVSSDITGGDCSGTRAAVCDPSKGIDGTLSYDVYDGAKPLKSTVTLTSDAQQNLCVEVEDRAGNVGLGSVSVGFRSQGAQLRIATPANGTKINADGGSGYTKDSDTSSADVCNANFDVACGDIGADVKLHRGDANGATLGTIKCAAKGNRDPDLPAGYAGWARFKNIAFLDSSSDMARIVATQATGSSTGESGPITITGDCKAPALGFDGDPCSGGQIEVADVSSTVTKTVAATNAANDPSEATLTVSATGSSDVTKTAALQGGKYTFSDVAFGGPGTGKRTIKVEVSAKDDFGNTGRHSCTADIVFDLPKLTVTAPADNAVFKPMDAALCNTDMGVTVTGTFDKAEGRTGVITVNGGAAMPLTLTGTSFSVCVPISAGKSAIDVKLTSTATTAEAKKTVNVTLVGGPPTMPIPLGNATLPADRNGTVTFNWTKPTENYTGQYVGYQMRCSTEAFTAPTVTDDPTGTQGTTWWNAARQITLPADFKPPATSVQVALRVGENNNCVLRGVDAADQLSAVASSVNALVPFRTQRFVPTIAGDQGGFRFAAVGDVNGDTYDDLLVGGQGSAYLVFGKLNGGWTSSTPDVSFTVEPTGSTVFFPTAVASLGDFNGDGLNDFALGDGDFNGLRGRVLVYYGRSTNDWGTTVDTSVNCVADLCLTSPTATDTLGAAIASAGDFTGDGRPDLAVGSPNVAIGAANTVGRLHVFLGKAYQNGLTKGANERFFNQSVGIDDATGVVQGFAFTGTVANLFQGQAVVGVGAFDDTAGDDLVMTAIGSGLPGRAYFVSGRTYTGPGLEAASEAQFGFRPSQNGTPNGAPFATGDSDYFGATVFYLGNAYNVPNATRTNVVDVAIGWGERNFFEIYPGDNNFAAADLIRVGPVGQTNLGVSVCTGRVRRASGEVLIGDLDGDGLTDPCASGNINLANMAQPAAASLWYSDTFATKVAASSSTPKAVDTRVASVLVAPDSTNVTAPMTGLGVLRVVDFAGDLNGDGKWDVVVGVPAANNNAGDFTILY